MADCDLCSSPGGNVLWRSPSCRVVRVDDPHYPGFCRVVWNEHVREMTDLSAEQRAYLMRVVFGVEAAVRELWQPDKMNVASLGNLTPHVHWHVIPRWRDDRHFPEPIWGKVQRDSVTAQRPEVDDARLQAALERALAAVAPDPVG